MPYITRSKRELNKINKQGIIQVQSALSIFNMKKGIIKGGYFRKGYLGDHCEFETTEVLGANFLHRHKKRLIKNYITFLNEYFQRLYNISMNKEENKEIY